MRRKFAHTGGVANTRLGGGVLRLEVCATRSRRCGCQQPAMIDLLILINGNQNNKAWRLQPSPAQSQAPCRFGVRYRPAVRFKPKKN